jgi:hypothetical protein
MKRLLAAFIMLLAGYSNAAISENFRNEDSSRVQSALLALLTSGCLTQDPITGAWILYSKTSTAEKCQFEDIDVGKFERVDLRTTPLTLAC